MTETINVVKTKSLSKYLSQDELKELLGIKQLQTLLKWSRQGILPAPKKLGRRYFWVEKEVEEYINTAVA